MEAVREIGDYDGGYRGGGVGDDGPELGFVGGVAEGADNGWDLKGQSVLVLEQVIL